MTEYFTKSIVLDREPRGEFDETITFYTKDLGKVKAFTRSSRKITSKLSGYLKPGRIGDARFVKKNNLQLVDILSFAPDCDQEKLLPFLNFIDQLIPSDDPDLHFWYVVEEIIQSNRFSPEIYRRLVDILGFGGELARCEHCENLGVSYFSLSNGALFCSNCAGQINFDLTNIIFLGEKQIVQH